MLRWRLPRCLIKPFLAACLKHGGVGAFEYLVNARKIWQVGSSGAQSSSTGRAYRLRSGSVLFSHYSESDVHLILLETDLELLRIRLLLAVSPSTTLASLTIAGASNEVMLSTSISLWPDHTGAQNIAPDGEEEETFAAISLPPVLRTHSEARWQMNWSLQSLASHLYYHAQLTTSSS